MMWDDDADAIDDYIDSKLDDFFLSEVGVAISAAVGIERDLIELLARPTYEDHRAAYTALRNRSGRVLPYPHME